MVELVDTADSKSADASRGGSSPSTRTKNMFHPVPHQLKTRMLHSLAGFLLQKKAREPCGSGLNNYWRGLQLHHHQYLKNEIDITQTMTLKLISLVTHIKPLLAPGPNQISNRQHARYRPTGAAYLH